MITVKNYLEATLDLRIPSELQAGHEYTLSYLDLYDEKMSLEEANRILRELGREELPYNVEISDVIDAHIAALNAAMNGGSKSKPAAQKSAAKTETAEWREAIESLQMLIDLGGSPAEIAEWREAVESLKMLMQI